MDGEAWWAIVHGVAKSRTRLSDLTLTLLYQKATLKQCGKLFCIPA